MKRLLAVALAALALTTAPVAEADPYHDPYHPDYNSNWCPGG